MVGVANLTLCPEVVITLGELVLAPEEGLTNGCVALVTADCVLDGGVESL